MEPDAKLPAWRAHRQGLDGSFAGKSIAQTLEGTGWARSVGGVGPYLGLFARCGASREAVDAAVAALEICELPCVRGCTYVLPATDFALGLKAGQGVGFEAEMKTALKLGVTDKEVEKLCAKVLGALQATPLEPDELKSVLGSAVRNLGEEGKKKGLTTTLPLALGYLQEQGEIRRIPVNGRLDQQRYRYTLWQPNPLEGFQKSTGEAHAELARRYFSWIGPATLAEYQWFSGLGVRAAKTAADSLGLEDIGGERLLLPALREAFESFEAPDEPQIAMVSSIDGLVLLRRDISGIPAGIKMVAGLKDLPSHAILDRGRIIGLWEYDVETASIAWFTFGEATAAVRERVARTEAYVRDELGDARSFSLDSPKSRVPRIAAIRRAKGLV